MINSYVVQDSIGVFPEILNYLRDLEVYQLTRVSRSWCRGSYHPRIWTPRLEALEWSSRFFLPPAGAGDLREIASRVFRHFVPGRHTPFYANRQLYLANAYPEVADRYSPVVPGVASLRMRARTATWVRLHLPSEAFHLEGVRHYWSWVAITQIMLLGIMIRVCLIPDVAQYTASMVTDRKLEYDSWEQCVYTVPSIILGISAVHAVQRIARRYVFHRINGPLASIAGRVAEFVMLGQLVAQRALQPIIYKVRVMIGRYLLHI